MVPALARGLIRHEALRSIRHCDGYTDLLGPTVPTRCTLARRARPIMNAALSMHGRSVAAEREEPPPHCISTASSVCSRWLADRAI